MSQITSEIILDPTKAINQADDAAKQITSKFDKARNWSDDLVKTATAKGAAIGGNAGMGLQKVAQFADDAQYGLKGVTNNISDTLMALGAGAGLAGAATIAAVGIQTVLIPALEKLAFGETEAARTARQQAAAELDAAQAKRRLAVETKIADKAHKDWETRLSSSISTVKAINAAVTESISRQQEWNDLKTSNAKAKIEAEDIPEIDRIKKIAAAEAGAMVEKNRLDRVAGQTTAANLNKEYEAQQKLYNETARAFGVASQERARIRKQSDALAGDKNTESQKKELEVQAEAFERQMAELKAKKEELGSSLKSLEGDRNSANKAYAKAVDEQKMLDIRLETNTIQSQQKIKKILEATAKEREQSFSAIADIGAGMAKKGDTAAGKFDKANAKDADLASDRAAFDAELQIQSLRAKGHDRQADKLKKEQAIIKETQALLKMGYTEQEAADRARRKADLDDPRKTNSSHRLTAEEMAAKGTRTSHNGLGSASFSGLDYLEKGKGTWFGKGRVGDQNFARLDAMAARQKESDAARQPRITDISKGPKSENNILVDGLASTTKELAALREIIAPLVKKYNASDLNQKPQ